MGRAGGHSRSRPSGKTRSSTRPDVRAHSGKQEQDLQRKRWKGTTKGETAAAAAGVDFSAGPSQRTEQPATWLTQAQQENVTGQPEGHRHDSGCYLDDSSYVDDRQDTGHEVQGNATSSPMSARSSVVAWNGSFGSVDEGYTYHHMDVATRKDQTHDYVAETSRGKLPSHKGGRRLSLEQHLRGMDQHFPSRTDAYEYPYAQDLEGENFRDDFSRADLQSYTRYQ